MRETRWPLTQHPADAALIRANRKLPPGKEYKYELVAAVRVCSYTQGKSKTGDTVLKGDFALAMNHTTIVSGVQIPLENWSSARQLLRAYIALFY